jgi:DNA helicase II / ATP-dependent DNA helicase PcrA
LPPTDEQRAVIDSPSAVFVHACPGAGKTETIVGRVSALISSIAPRRGLAVLSFTNAALEEFTRRCVEVSLERVLRHPHYVGTFDAFVRHFLVLPGGLLGCDARPNIVDSWRTLGVEVRLQGRRAFRGSGVSLDLFDPETGRVDAEHIGVQALRNHVTQNQQAYERAAHTTRARLRRHGTLSAGDARVEACKKLRDAAWQRALGAALHARFGEVLVDEGQDCTPQDIEILTWLRSLGVPITLVADPDQSIYEFRRSVPTELNAFRESYAPESRPRLTGNFRSSPPICGLAATLRSDRVADRSVGETAQSVQPVVVCPYDGDVSPDIGEWARTVLSGILGETATSVVLAHKRKSAQKAVGRDSPDGGTSRIAALARAVAGFHSESVSLRARESALRVVEGLLLDFMGRLGEHETPAQALTRHAMNHRVMRRQALELLTSLPKHCPDDDASRQAWIDTARRGCEALGLSCPATQTAARFLRNPPNRTWAHGLRLRAEVEIQYSTVHEAKGKQFDAVILVIPPDRAPASHTTELFTAWENGTELEAKRVVYVAVTRARRLVVLAIPSAHLARCQTILQAARVSFETNPPLR